MCLVNLGESKMVYGSFSFFKEFGLFFGVVEYGARSSGGNGGFVSRFDRR